MADTEPTEIRILLAGDVMLGRGIDQVLPHPGDPTIYEHWREIDSAKTFVERAARVNGPVPDVRDIGYVWGDVLSDFEAFRPDVTLINLETAVTRLGEPWPNKRIHYRMHPGNVGVLNRAGVDVCALANNHVLDWGHDGMAETMAALDGAGIRHAGAGADRAAAEAPVILDLGDKGRVIVVSLATPNSGVPLAWAAKGPRPGLNLVDLDDEWIDYLRGRWGGLKRDGDILIVSIHWGDNYQPPLDPRQRHFARRLIDEAAVDIVHGHSSHHVRGIELYRDRPIFYGCGDLVNDYEGADISPERETFAPNLGLAYFARFAAGDGRLIGLQMRPTRMRQLRVRRAADGDPARLMAILNHAKADLGAHIVESGGFLCLRAGAD